MGEQHLPWISARLTNNMFTPIRNYNWRIHQTKSERQTQYICVYIYSKNASIHEYTTQWNQSIQRCLIQHAYTKALIVQHVPKEKVYTKNLKKSSSCPPHWKPTRTTQPEEGKGREMSNAITKWVNNPHNSNSFKMKPNNNNVIKS